VSKNITSFVSQGAMENVTLAKATTIGGAYSVNVALALNEATGGARAVQIGAAHSELVVGSRQETVDKDKLTKVGTMFSSHVKKGVQQTTAKDVTEKVGANTGIGVVEATAWLAGKFELKAEKFNLVVNDKLILQVEKSGNTKLFANKLTLDGSDIKFKGSKVQMLGAGSLQSMSKKVQDLENLQEQNPEPNVMKFNLKDESGKTLANQSFEIKLPDGTVKKGKTDGSGNARVEDVPAGQHEISFPGLDGAVQ
jgi:type VI secretion system secreted protein VgrG